MTLQEIDDLEARLHGLQLPEGPVQLDPGVTITDVQQFINAQFVTLRNAPDAKTSLPCLWRIEKFIAIVEGMQ